MEDFTPSRATSSVNISRSLPGLEQEFALFTGTTRQSCLCCPPVALATSSCAVRLPKILHPPKKAFLWVNIHILKRRKGGRLCPMPDVSGFGLVKCKLASWETAHSTGSGTARIKRIPRDHPVPGTAPGRASSRRKLPDCSCKPAHGPQGCPPARMLWYPARSRFWGDSARLRAALRSVLS